MKKLFYAALAALVVGAVLSGCGAKKETADHAQPTEASAAAAEGEITAEMACEGVTNYCRGAYDWSAAKENPSIMYVEMGEESETEYQVVFHSYTGALVYFYVDKSDGTTKMTEYVPALNIEEEAGSFRLSDYLEKQG